MTYTPGDGLTNDVFNPGKPTIISLGSLFGSGNTGSFREQARVEHFFKPNDSFQRTTRLSVSEPVSTIVTCGRRNASRETDRFGAAGELVETLCGKGRQRETPRA